MILSLKYGINPEEVSIWLKIQIKKVKFFIHVILFYLHYFPTHNKGEELAPSPNPVSWHWDRGL